MNLGYEGADRKRWENNKKNPQGGKRRCLIMVHETVSDIAPLVEKITHTK